MQVDNFNFTESMVTLKFERKTVFSMNWSVRPDKRFRLALGSFVEKYNNKVQIVSLDEDTSEFTAKSTFDHPYPTTKIMWIPDSKGIYPGM